MSIFALNTVFFAVAIVCFYAARKATTAKKQPPWWIVPVLVFVGGSCLAASVIGQWAASRISGLGASLLVGAVSLILLVCVIFDLRDKVANKMAIVGLIALPILFAAGTGPLAELGNSFSGGAAESGAATIGKMIGG